MRSPGELRQAACDALMRLWQAGRRSTWLDVVDEVSAQTPLGASEKRRLHETLRHMRREGKLEISETVKLPHSKRPLALLRPAASLGAQRQMFNDMSQWVRQCQAAQR